MDSELACDESALARRLVDGAVDAPWPTGGPTWVMVAAGPDGGMEPVACDGGFDPLGWSAPPECRMFAMVGTGRVRSLDDGVELAANLAGGRAGGVRMACVVSRPRGRVGWHMVLPDGSSFDRVPEEGRMLDVLKRCLGLPTPPPPATAARLHDAAWLAAIICTGTPDRPMSWSTALDLHPALQGRDCGLDTPTKEYAIDVAVSRCSWDDLRLAVAADRHRGPGLPDAELAAWMDAGMFARWLLAAVSDLDELLVLARPHLRPAAGRRLTHMIRSAG